MTDTEKSFFIDTGNQSLISDTTNSEYSTILEQAENDIKTAARHFSTMAKRAITDDEFNSLTVEGNSYTVGDDWKNCEAIIAIMASEIYSKMGMNGIKSSSESGLSQSYAMAYSDSLISLIKSCKHIGTIAKSTST